VPLSFSSIEAIERYLNKWVHSYIFEHLPSWLVARLSRRSRAGSSQQRPSALAMSDWSSPSPMWKRATSASITKGGRASLTSGKWVYCCQNHLPPILCLRPPPFTAAVVQHLNWLSCSNLDTMSKIHAWLVMLVDPTLGTSTCT